MSRIEMPEDDEERIILMESIANSVMNDVMPAREKHGLDFTDSTALVRSIVDKVFRELEEDAEEPEEQCEGCGCSLYQGDPRNTWADGVVTCIPCGPPTDDDEVPA